MLGAQPGLEGEGFAEVEVVGVGDHNAVVFGIEVKGGAEFAGGPFGASLQGAVVFAGVV